MIEVNEYVRVDGNIGKVIDICDCEQCKQRGYLEPVIDNPYIYITIFDKEHDFHGINHSKNVIDLIELGDYVNGKLVNDIEKFENGTIYIKFSEHDYICDYQQHKIKTILTKEQYEANCYKVKEE